MLVCHAAGLCETPREPPGRALATPATFGAQSFLRAALFLRVCYRPPMPAPFLDSTVAEIVRELIDVLDSVPDESVEAAVEKAIKQLTDHYMQPKYAGLGTAALIASGVVVGVQATTRILDRSSP